eukprot:1306761-Amphidinium_carterae.1
MEPNNGGPLASILVECCPVRCRVDWGPKTETQLEGSTEVFAVFGRMVKSMQWGPLSSTKKRKYLSSQTMIKARGIQQ